MPRLRSVDKAALDALLSANLRIATHAELKATGLGASTITNRIRHGGPWTRVLPGVVAAHSGRPSRRQRLIGAVKYAGDGAVITGMTALREYGLRAAANHTGAHLLIPHDRRRTGREYVTVERTRRMPEPVELHGLRYAPVARAVIDACRRMDDLDMVRDIVAEAVQTGGVSQPS